MPSEAVGAVTAGAARSCRRKAQFASGAPPLASGDHDTKEPRASNGSSGGSEDPAAAPDGGYDEQQYGEDLAQLDMLLHYVNNLSASLEFVAWENKREWELEAAEGGDTFCSIVRTTVICS